MKGHKHRLYYTERWVERNGVGPHILKKMGREGSRRGWREGRFGPKLWEVGRVVSSRPPADLQVILQVNLLRFPVVPLKCSSKQAHSVSFPTMFPNCLVIHLASSLSKTHSLQKNNFLKN